MIADCMTAWFWRIRQSNNKTVFVHKMRDSSLDQKVTSIWAIACVANEQNKKGRLVCNQIVRPARTKRVVWIWCPRRILRTAMVHCSNRLAAPARKCCASDSRNCKGLLCQHSRPQALAQSMFGFGCKLQSHPDVTHKSGPLLGPLFNFKSKISICN